LTNRSITVRSLGCCVTSTDIAGHRIGQPSPPTKFGLFEPARPMPICICKQGSGVAVYSREVQQRPRIAALKSRPGFEFQRPHPDKRRKPNVR
jgi:hypothetical protein